MKMKRKIKTAITAAACTAVILLTHTSCSLTIMGTESTGGFYITPYPSASSSSKVTELPIDPLGTSDTEVSDTSSSAPIEEPVLEKKYTNPISGVPSAYDSTGMRPIAVVIDNGAGAIAHQTGVAEADILYETLVAPGITRFLAIYADYRSQREICNIRAGRVCDVHIAENYGAVLVSHGGHSDMNKEYDFFSAVSSVLGGKSSFINTINEPAWSAEGGEELGTIKYYESNYRSDLKYDTVVTPEAIEYVLSSKRYSEFAKSGGSFSGEVKNLPSVSDTPLDGETCLGADISFTAKGAETSLKKDVSYIYDGASDKYLRYEGERAHVDSKTGEQLAFSNILFLLTDVKYIDGDERDPLTTDVAVKGSGTGYYLSNGKYVSVIWVNTSGGMKIYSSSGELSLCTGNTYVAFLDRTDGSVRLHTSK